jgi:hypothetical protein
MAKKRPVRIWRSKERPRREPKFQRKEIFDGAAKSKSLR